MATDETRRRILDAAETLFARQGFGATSLRTVIARARVNLAAIHYHFGSKDALIRAVFARRITPLNAERLARLDRCLSAGADRPSVEAVLESLIRPTLGLGKRNGNGGPALSALIARVHGEGDDRVSELFYEQFEDVSRRYLAVLAELLPHLSPEERSSRFHFVIASMASALSDGRRIECLSSGLAHGDETEVLAERLITFLAAGLRAPACASPTLESRTRSIEGGAQTTPTRDPEPASEVRR